MPVIIIFISLGFCSSSTGSLRYGFQTHVAGCSLGRLFPFIPLHSGVNLRRQHPHLPTVDQHFSTLPFRDSIFIQRWTEQSSLILVSGSISRSSGTSRWPWGQAAITPSLRDFSSFLTWEVSFIFLTVQLCILK